MIAGARHFSLKTHGITPWVSCYYANNSPKGYGVLEDAPNRLFASGVILISPLQPGDPTKCMHFAGSPIRAFLPRVRKGFTPPKMRDLLYVS